jgi:hypothetical protein
MKPVWKFRLFALTVIVFVLGISISNLAAEFLRPAPLALPNRTNPAPISEQISSAGRASATALFRSDLKAEYALALAGRTLKSEYDAQAQRDETAENAVKKALQIGPHDSRMWLALALLQARSNLGDPLIAQSLKMSYLTGPNRSDLIPLRLDAVTLGNPLNDADLNELARGDVRVILTRFPDQRQTLVNDYIRASSIGKTFLEDSARMYDPQFADSLRSAK